MKEIASIEKTKLDGTCLHIGKCISLQWMMSNQTEPFVDWEMHFLAVDDVKPN